MTTNEYQGYLLLEIIKDHKRQLRAAPNMYPNVDVAAAAREANLPGNPWEFSRALQHFEANQWIYGRHPVGDVVYVLVHPAGVEQEMQIRRTLIAGVNLRDE